MSLKTKQPWTTVNRSVRIRKSRKGHNSKFTSCTKWGQMNQTDTVGVLTPTLQVCVRSSVDGIQVFRPFNHHRTHTHCSMRSDPGSAMECAVAADFSLRHSQPASPDRGRPRRAQAQSPPPPHFSVLTAVTVLGGTPCAARLAAALRQALLKLSLVFLGRRTWHCSC